MSNIAHDKVGVPKAIASLDSPGPIARSIQSAFQMVSEVQGFVRTVKADGTGKYLLSEQWTEGTRAAFETNIDDLGTALGTAAAELKALLKLS